jgi:putative transposase
MALKRHSDEDILKLLREIEVKLSASSDVQSACRGVGLSDATYYNWRKLFYIKKIIFLMKLSLGSRITGKG